MPHDEASPAPSEHGFDIAGALVPDDVNLLSRRNDAASTNAKDRVDIDKYAILTSDEDDEGFIAARQAASNRKSSNMLSKSAKRSGGFQAMGLNLSLLKEITRKGFSVPTPIQRKTIPLILNNQDVVGMARTGSGKTAAFVIPMLEKLKTHSVKVGARALILSPSRELALQTMKIVKEFGRGTNLRTTLLVGGDSLEDQFGQMSNNPDIIIATPGRFLHLMVEMSLDLSPARFIVFDEADRLFEMGFATQLREILNALPPSRQTLLFSATLPANLVEFANAGLRDPSLVRLDVESKISPDLQSAFFTVKPAEKEGALLHILHELIGIPQGPAKRPRLLKADVDNKRSKKRKRESMEPAPHDLSATRSTVIFAATKHHVEYISALLRLSGFNVSYVYGSLDQTARRSQVEMFRSGETMILIVTDVAARGIDIPLLANVINYDFPSQPKVFVHRVGRTARAGRKGWSYSLVQSSDVPYLLDLQLFLSRKLVVGRHQVIGPNFAEDIIVGQVPRSNLERNMETITKLLEDDEVSGLKSVALKSEKLYTRTRNAASLESMRRAKRVCGQRSFEEPNLIYGEHEISQSDRDIMLARISGFRPAETVFELGRQKGETNTEAAKAALAMRNRRHKSRSAQTASSLDIDDKTKPQNDIESDGARSLNEAKLEGIYSYDDSEEELEVTFPNTTSQNKSAQKGPWQDSANFMSYEPSQTSLAEDRGYGVHTGSNQSSRAQIFIDVARHATMELNNDESKSFAEPSRPRQMRWDKRSKKYVSRSNDEDGSRGIKMITSESGQKIAASFRSGRFEAWKKSNKMDRLPRTGELESNAGSNSPATSRKRFKHYAARAPKQPDKHRDDYYKKKKRLETAKISGVGSSDLGRREKELRSVDEVRKQRQIKQKRREKNARRPRKKGM